MKVGGNCYCLKGKDYINLSLGRNGDIRVNFAKMLPCLDVSKWLNFCDSYPSWSSWGF